MRARASGGIRAKTFSMVAPALYAGIRTKTFSTIHRGERSPVVVDVVAHGRLERIVQAPARLPSEQRARFRDVRDAAVGIVVARAVELLAGDGDDLGERDR